MKMEKIVSEARETGNGDSVTVVGAGAPSVSRDIEDNRGGVKRHLLNDKNPLGKVAPPLPHRRNAPRHTNP